MQKSLMAAGVMMLITCLSACGFSTAAEQQSLNPPIAQDDSTPTVYPTLPATSTLMPTPAPSPTVTPVPTNPPPSATPTPSPIPTETLLPTSPPAPTSTRIPGRFFRAQLVRGYPGTGPGNGQNQSSVSGRVVDRQHNGIPNALLYINNGGPNSPYYETNGNGEYYIPNLGDSSWSIVLTYVPGRKISAESKHQFYVNGSPEQQAIVNFLER